jgi:hypothetical protein
VFQPFWLIIWLLLVEVGVVDAKAQALPQEGAALAAIENLLHKFFLQQQITR